MRLALLGLPEMTGGVNPGDQRALHLLIHALKPLHVLEVGTHIGCSTVNIALALRDVHRERTQSPSLWTVDILDVNNPFTEPWESYGSQSSPRELVAQAGCADITTFVTGEAVECLSHGAQGFDLIFLDGDHSESAVYHEIPLALQRLNPGGHILLHDYFPEGRQLWPGHPPITGPWQAVQRLRTQGLRIRALPLGELPWPTKLGTQLTTLALVVPD
jgi:predicted O-methyltransferase YrrM